MSKNAITLSIISTLSIFIFGGCGNSHDDYIVVVPPVETGTTLFLIDQYGFSLGDIPYICDSMNGWSATRPNGEFTFIEPENCIFDFSGLKGNYNNDQRGDDIIYIVDDLDRGKGDIFYRCEYFGASATYLDGSFNYDENDICTFYL
jgi:hypothetical protein